MAQSAKLLFVGSNPTLHSSISVLRSTDRILGYEPGDGGSIPSGPAKQYADIAQSEEQETFNLKVAGSIPAVRTKNSSVA